MTVTQRIRWSDTDQKAIREQLDRILHSIPFQRNIKGYDVALEVFGRPANI
ncbi:MAG: hypothetical protein WBQ20_08000 [Methyloceanibacter sp.]